MARGQHKNTINNTQGNMTSAEISHLPTARPRHSNTAEEQENDFKSNLMKTVKEMNKSLQKLRKSTARESIFMVSICAQAYPVSQSSTPQFYPEEACHTGLLTHPSSEES